MYRIQLINKAVGNGLRNQEHDVKALKQGFQDLGLYRDTIDNGYMDRPLNDAIWSFQRDNGLKRDGVIRPGGETEATMIGRRLGYRSPPYRESGGVIQAAVPAAALLPPLAHQLARHTGRTAPAAWAWWQSLTSVQRQVVLNEMEGGQDDEEAREAGCERQNERDVASCRRLDSKKRRAICYESANHIYGACLAGKPESAWPELKDY